MKQGEKHLPLKKVLKDKLKDPEFRFYFEESRKLTKLCLAIAKMRLSRDLTQSQLAKACGTTQSVIARLESGNNGRLPSLNLLNRIANALKLNLTVGFEERRAA